MKMDNPLTLVEIRAEVVDLSTYGYRRTCALVRRRRYIEGRPLVNAKRVSMVKRTYGLLLSPSPRRGAHRRHDGQIAVDQSALRWCSDASEIPADNG
jgi:hypothetical protein